jgi:8-oxo-dGTP diphosphatase
MTTPLPYKIAVLCYLFDARGHMLLIHRLNEPNKGLYSPIGGKLQMELGESPSQCAQREIEEEAGIHVDLADLHLTGLVSERAFAGQTHWLMFCYEMMTPVVVTRTQIREGKLEWHDPATIEQLNIPETDRQVIWPLFQQFRGQFFHVHIDCAAGQGDEGTKGRRDERTKGQKEIPLQWRLEYPRPRK